MEVISERDFSDAIAATKKDAKLVAAAKNDRMNSAETLYREFEKLTVDRRREIIIQVTNEYFVAAQWKIGFPLNNFPAAILPDAVQAVGKALFFSREEDAVRETVRAIKLYQNSPFLKRIALHLGEMAEITTMRAGKAAAIVTEPQVFAMIRSLDPANPSSERIVETIFRVTSYTRDQASVLDVARFLHARRFSANLPELAKIVDESIFLARDRRSVRQIIEGLTAGPEDGILQRLNGHKD